MRGLIIYLPFTVTSLLNQALSRMMTQPNKAHQACLMRGPAGGVASRIRLFNLAPPDPAADPLST